MLKRLLLLVLVSFIAIPGPVQAQNSYSAGECVALARDLTLGSRGSDVTQLQNFLLLQNYPGSGSWMVTGYFGRATRQAVLNFQSQRYITPTGSVGPKTRQAIANATCAANFISVSPANMAPTFSLSPATAYPYSSISLYGIYPAWGAVGTPVTIFGSGFSSRGNTIHFGPGIIINVGSSDGRTLSFIVPSRLTGFGSQSLTVGTYNVSVTNESGERSAALPFTVTSLEAVPVPTTTGGSQTGTATSTGTGGTATTTPPSATRMLWGAFVDRGLTQTANFESMVGRTMDMQAVFASWGENNGAFPANYAPLIRDKGKTMVLFWEPNDSDSTPNDPRYSNDSIINGSWDNYIRSFSRSMIEYGGPIILVPMEEMNGRWYPWNGTVNNNSAAKFITAWRHIHDLVMASGATNVKFGWAVNVNSVPDIPGNKINDYYPGSQYVDYVGVDGFNLNQGWGWETFNDKFPDSLNELQQYNKPIYIFSMGSTAGPRKAEWIRDALGVQVHKYPVVGWIWFNQGEFRVDTDPQSLAAFKEVIPR